MKKGKGDPEGAKRYREAKNRVRRESKKEKGDWIEHQCTKIEETFCRTTQRRHTKWSKTSPKENRDDQQAFRTKQGNASLKKRKC